MSLVNSDENKTFGVVLRTPVENSKGIPHILEHSVLCGSRKYPIKVNWLLRNHCMAPPRQQAVQTLSPSLPSVPLQADIFHLRHPLKPIYFDAGAVCGAHEGLPQHLPECVHLPRPHLLPCRVLQPAGRPWRCIVQPMISSIKFCCLLRLMHFLH